MPRAVLLRVRRPRVSSQRQAVHGRIHSAAFVEFCSCAASPLRRHEVTRLAGESGVIRQGRERLTLSRVFGRLIWSQRGCKVVRRWKRAYAGLSADHLVADQHSVGAASAGAGSAETDLCFPEDALYEKRVNSTAMLGRAARGLLPIPGAAGGKRLDSEADFISGGEMCSRLQRELKRPSRNQRRCASN